MSAESQPISPARFAEAIADLSLASLQLKVLEIRNDIAHLDYSNEQLLPFAQGKTAVLGAAATADQTDAAAEPDQDCIDAIRENQAVIERKLEQIRLVRTEVEKRGVSWASFCQRDEGADERQEAEAAEQRAATAAAALAAGQAAVGMGAHSEANGEHRLPETNGTHGVNGTSTPNGTSDPWSDGTFQTGTIRNGVLQMDVPGRPGQQAQAGGSLSDDQLRRALEERLRTNGTDDDDDVGLHL